jgi:hypothetical protein
VGICRPPSHFVFLFSHSFNLYLVFFGVHLHALSQWRLCFVYHKISCWLKLGLQPGAFLGCPGHSYNETVSTEALIMNCICHTHPDSVLHMFSPGLRGGGWRTGDIHSLKHLMRCGYTTQKMSFLVLFKGIRNQSIEGLLKKQKPFIA